MTEENTLLNLRDYLDGGGSSPDNGDSLTSVINSYGQLIMQSWRYLSNLQLSQLALCNSFPPKDCNPGIVGPVENCKLPPCLCFLVGRSLVYLHFQLLRNPVPFTKM
jgi:hypothetical protein